MQSEGREGIGPNETTLQRTNNENSKQVFPEKELYGHGPLFHIHVSVIYL